MRLTKIRFKCKIKKHNYRKMTYEKNTRHSLMIRNQKNKLLTLLVAGVVGTAAFGGALMNNVTADAAENTYSLSTIFTPSTDVTLSKNGEEETVGFRNQDLTGKY